MPWAGVKVSPLFRQRWLSRNHVGAAKPHIRMEIRHGHLKRRWHTREEDPAITRHGQVAHSTRWWYADWIVDTDWEDVPGVKNVRLEQSFDNKGVKAATINLDNTVLQEHGSGLGLYHTIERGFYSPLKGYVFPGSLIQSPRPHIPGVETNANFMKLPNAQVRVWMGYGEDAMEVTFLGLIDDIDIGTQGQAIQVIARDFGGVMVDQNVFGWAKDRAADDPITFMPKDMHEKVTRVGNNPRASSHEPGHSAHYNLFREDHHNPWWSDDNPIPVDNEWIQIHVKPGFYKGLYIVGDFDDQKFYVGVYCRPRDRGKGNYGTCAWHPDTGEIVHLTDDHLQVRNHWTGKDGKVVPTGWLNLHQNARIMPMTLTHDNPNDHEWAIFKGPWSSKKGKGIHLDFGGKILLGNDSVFRVGITPLPFHKGHRYRDGRQIFRAGVRKLQAERVTEVDKSIKKGENHIPIGDVSEIAETIFRWAGFKEWEVEGCGVDLQHNYIVGKDKKFMDIMDDLQAQTGWVFFMAEPSDNGEASIGRPIFRQNRVFEQTLDHQEQVTDKDLLEDMKVKFANADERSIIRVAGKALSPKKGGQRLSNGGIYRALYAYIPPWARDFRMAGVIKPLTHYDEKVTTIDECRMGCYLIALQIILAKITAIADLSGTPGISLDSYISIIDEASGINSRMYVANAVQEFTAGTDAKYTLSLGGSIPDTPDMKTLLNEFWAWVVTLDRNSTPMKKRKKKPPHKHKSISKSSIGHSAVSGRGPGVNLGFGSMDGAGNGSGE